MAGGCLLKAATVAAVIAYLLTGAGTTGRGANRTGVRGDHRAVSSRSINTDHPPA
jgi:hypothetical protein